jgi:hypothetical protein
VEPLRWLGINSAIRLATMADRTEQRRGVDGRASKWYERLASAGSDSEPDPSPDA